MHVKPSIRLVSVSDRRRQFLSEWRRERSLVLALREEEVENAPISPANAATAETKDKCDLAQPAPFDRIVETGDIRLIGPGSVTDPHRFAYVAVLDGECGDGVALVAPFSTYANPATKDEWLTGIESAPLRVLQFWGALPVPLFALARSWHCCRLTAEELATARELYRHAIAGTWPAAALREQTGLAIHDQADDRLVYQEEELALYAPLREALFDLQEAIENPPVATHRDRKLWLDDARFDRFADGVAVKELLAADAGDIYAQVTILPAGDADVVPCLARRIAHRSLADGQWESRWEIQEWPNARPGLPVFAYAESTVANSPAASAFTGGPDGTLVVFDGNNPILFGQLGSRSLWLLVREV